jgi:hypothetical protein
VLGCEADPDAVHRRLENAVEASFRRRGKL